MGGAEIHVAVNTGEERRGKHNLPTQHNQLEVKYFPAGSFQFHIKNISIFLYFLESSHSDSTISLELFNLHSAAISISDNKLQQNRLAGKHSAL